MTTSGVERKTNHQAAVLGGGAGSETSSVTTAAAAGLGAGAAEARAVPMNIMAQHLSVSEMAKMRAKIPTMPFCHAVQEVRRLQNSAGVASRVTAATTTSRAAVTEASTLYLKRIADQYNRAAAAVGAELLAEPTLIQAEALVALLNHREGDYLETPLVSATREGKLDRVKELIGLGVELNTQDKVGSTALSIAVSFRQEAMVQQLLAATGINVNTARPDKRHPLMSAATAGDHAMVGRLLKVSGIDVNARSESGTTALISAAALGHEAVVRLLLAAPGIEVNAQDLKDKFTALLLAAANGCEEVVRQLLAVPDIDATLQEVSGLTALDVAKTPEIAALLKEAASKKSSGPGAGGAGAAGAGASGMGLS